MSGETLTIVAVRLNGEQKEFPQGTSLLDLVRTMNLPEDRLAIEYNRLIVKRELWASTLVQDRSEIEIVHFVGGG